MTPRKHRMEDDSGIRTLKIGCIIVCVLFALAIAYLIGKTVIVGDKAKERFQTAYNEEIVIVRVSPDGHHWDIEVIGEFHSQKYTYRNGKIYEYYGDHRIL